MQLNFSAMAALGLLTVNVLADGCQNCAGFDRGQVDESCITQCQAVFDPASEEYGLCQDECDKIVYKEGCCTTTICPSARKREASAWRTDSSLTLDDLKRHPTLINALSLAVRDPPYDHISTNEELQALSPSFANYTLEEHSPIDGRPLEERDYSSCCASCRRTAGRAGNYCPTSILTMAASAA